MALRIFVESCRYLICSHHFVYNGEPTSLAIQHPLVKTLNTTSFKTFRLIRRPSLFRPPAEMTNKAVSIPRRTRTPLKSTKSGSREIEFKKKMYHVDIDEFCAIGLKVRSVRNLQKNINIKFYKSRFVTQFKDLVKVIY